MKKFEVNISAAIKGYLENTIRILAETEEEAKEEAIGDFKRFLKDSDLNLELDPSEEIDICIYNKDDDEDYKVYDISRYNTFVADMERAGLEVRDYGGRGGYRGPGVDCDDISEVMSQTKVECRWDNMGLGYIVYPR